MALGILTLGLALLGACVDETGGGNAAGDAGGPCFPNGTCNAGLVCTSGFCIPDSAGADAGGTDVDAAAPCVAACEDKACGDNGCGGSCGACEGELFCNVGVCEDNCVSDPECPAGQPGVCADDWLSERACVEVADGCYQLGASSVCPEGERCEDGACHLVITADCVVIKPIDTRTAQPTVGSVAVAFSVAACDGEPIINLGPSSFAIYEDGAPVSATESGADILPREAVTYVTLVLDNSPSVKAAGGLEDAVAAAKDFASQLMTDDPLGVRVAVAVFSIAFELRQEHSSDLSEVEAAIDGLLTDETGINTTNLYGALIDAVAYNGAVQDQLFEDMRGGVLTQGQVILFTDGSDQAAVATLEEAQAAAAATTDEVRMVAFGTEVDVDVLESLATAGAYVGASSSELGALFSTIAQQIQAQREALYVLGYCSPKLAGTHELTLEIPGKGTSPPVSFSAEGWLGAITAGAPSCKAAQFAVACADAECGGLWCGGCVELCTEDLLCGCNDPTFTGAYCDQCANPKLAPPDCTSCVNPLFTGEACDVCADTKFTGAACDVCADPGFTGPACDLPSPCPEAPDGTWCDDGDACTVNDACATGLCEGTPTGLVCDDDNPCTSDACDPATGACAATSQAGPCSDGNGCTTGDYCQAGACVSGINQCACETDADCAWKEDGDLCNGTLMCGMAAGVPACIVDPQTVVTCPEVGGACGASVCEPATGVCETTSSPDGTSCDNGDVCDGLETCQAGECTAGAGLSCDDGVEWTADSCDSIAGCLFEPAEGASCDDGDACSDDDTVTGGVCVGAAISCDDADLCNGFETCDSATGCQPGAAPTCDDGDVCNGVETCDSTAGCVMGTALTCDDANPCNGIEGCDPDAGCYLTDDEPCPDDGDGCTVEYCSDADQACTSVPLSCGDGDPCTLDSCEDDGDEPPCVHLPDPACTGCNCDPGTEVQWDSVLVEGQTIEFGYCPSAACLGADVCTQNQCIVEACLSPFGGGCGLLSPPALVNSDGVHEESQCHGMAHVCLVPQCSVVALLVLPDELLAIDCDDDDVCTLDACDPVGGCVNADNPVCDGDADDDGSPDDEDCEPFDPNISPDIAEACNGVDDNCDGVIDDAPVDGSLCDDTHACTGGGCIDCCPNTQCGIVNCGGSTAECGTCLETEKCTADGQCCAPQCADLECGDDGCGGSCASCDECFACEAGMCLYYCDG